MAVLDAKFGLRNCISNEIKDYKGTCFSGWPPHSPDLNVLDFSIWSLLKRRGLELTEHGFYETREDLKLKIKEAWASIPQQHIYNSCVRGMKHRIMKCIAVDGACTKNYRPEMHRSNLPYDIHRDNDLNVFS